MNPTMMKDFDFVVPPELSVIIKKATELAFTRRLRV